MCQSTASITSSEVAVWTTWAVELATRGDVKDTATHSEVYWCTVATVVWKESAWCEGLEDDCWLRFWDCDRCLWAKLKVGDQDKEGEKDEVDWCEDGLPDVC